VAPSEAGVSEALDAAINRASETVKHPRLVRACRSPRLDPRRLVWLPNSSRLGANGASGLRL